MGNLLTNFKGQYPCGDDSASLERISKVSECFISLEKSAWWISSFYWIQIFFCMLFIIYLILAVRSMPAKREAIMQEVEKRAEERYER